jgi:DNA-binding NtrC family response regulator
VAYIAASQRPLQELCRSREIAESPFFNIFAQVRLGPLQDSEALDLICRPSHGAGLPLEPHQHGLLELGGPLPLFLQMACCALFEHLADGREQPAWPEVEAAFLEEADPHYAYLWERFSEAERSALARIVAGQPPAAEDTPAIERLVAQGYLMRQERRTVPFCGSFARFVHRAGGGPSVVEPASAAVASAVPEPAAAASVEVEPTPIGAQPYPRLLGQSLALRRVLALVQRAVESDISVVLTGETGTGKELVARTIHEIGARRDQAFVAVNCGSIAESLQESELFGHKKGAFTDAVSDRAGLFETADGGTLFLDEIGDTSPATQVRLLRALQSGEVRRLGENQARCVDVRLICATNRDLEAEMRAGHFRDDLYYRLYVLAIHLPPLRARQGDVALLVQHFLQSGAERVSDEAMACLEAYAWPGNIRELANQVASARAMAGGGVIEARHLWVRVRQASGAAPPGPAAGDIDPGLPLKEARECFERAYLHARLQACSWRLDEAARSLGVSRSRLYELVRHYNLRSA